MMDKDAINHHGDISLPNLVLALGLALRGGQSE
jgi:hypothetical protein